jgi:hypothetical protein
VAVSVLPERVEPVSVIPLPISIALLPVPLHEPTCICPLPDSLPLLVIPELVAPVSVVLPVFSRGLHISSTIPVRSIATHLVEVAYEKVSNTIPLPSLSVSVSFVLFSTIFDVDLSSLSTLCASRCVPVGKWYGLGTASSIIYPPISILSHPVFLNSIYSRLVSSVVLGITDDISMAALVVIGNTRLQTKNRKSLFIGR